MGKSKNINAKDADHAKIKRVSLPSHILKN